MSFLKLKDTSLIDITVQRADSRSVSWNTTGAYLAMGFGDKTIRIWSVTESSSREVMVISDHQAPCVKTRFSKTEPAQLLTGGQDKTVRLWDVRNAQQRSVSSIELSKGRFAVSLEWSPATNYFVLAEEDGTVYIYDTRKLSAKSSSKDATSSFSLVPQAVETCQFSPDGQYLVAGCNSTVDGAGQLRVWKWDSPEGPDKPIFHDYPAAVGPIYASQFSRNGKLLATGGADAIVGLWDARLMCCTHTVVRRQKFIRSVAFSHDDKIIASSSEDEGVDLANASDGTLIGVVKLSSGNWRSMGAEEVAWHPKEYLLACAKVESGRDCPVTVAKISVDDSQ